MTHTFEDVARLLEELSTPVAEMDFTVEWLERELLAIGIDHLGRCALLIAGAAINPTIDVVESAVRAGSWKTTDERVILGSLIRLPRGDAFRTALAAIAAELIRRGIGERATQEVFTEVEPFIALVLRRVLLPESYLLGLIGELLVLRAFLSVASTRKEPPSVDPLSVWHGWRQEARDIVLGTASLEVKTTGLSVSRHMISGFEQIEPRVLDETSTEKLFIVSVGLRRALAKTDFSVAGLTRDIIQLLGERAQDPDDAERKFLDMLASYGPAGFDGYQHNEMKEQEPYTLSFTTTFAPRIYDMADENIRVIRRRDLADQFSCVLPLGVHFTVELPDVIPGSIENPKTDLGEFLTHLAEQI